MIQNSFQCCRYQRLGSGPRAGHPGRRGRGLGGHGRQENLQEIEGEGNQTTGAHLRVYHHGETSLPHAQSHAKGEIIKLKSFQFT